MFHVCREGSSISTTEFCIWGMPNLSPRTQTRIKFSRCSMEFAHPTKRKIVIKSSQFRRQVFGTKYLTQYFDLLYRRSKVKLTTIDPLYEEAKDIGFEVIDGVGLHLAFDKAAFESSVQDWRA